MWAGLKLYSNLRRVDFTFSYISSITRCVPWCFQIPCYICEEIFTTLSFKVCLCELREPQCIRVAAGVAVGRGARISIASHGDTGLWEESIPHRPSCIQLHHELSFVLTVFLRRSSLIYQRGHQPSISHDQSLICF